MHTNNFLSKYSCKECNYFSLYQSTFKRHLESMKHINNMSLKNQNIKPLSLNDILKKNKYECECGVFFNYKSGLSRHKKICNFKKENNSGINNDIFNTLILKNQELNNNLIALLTETLVKTSSHNTNHIGTLNNITNKVGTINNNTNVNMMVFLDNYCKDAISINQFVEGLEIQVEDLLHTKDKGIIQGISNIFVNALKDMDIYKRPIHCSDLKRATLFIKDDENWTKGKEGREKLSTAIKHISQMQMKLIPEWESTCGQELNKEQLDSEFAKIVKRASTYIEPNSKEEDKIIKSIAKEVAINKQEFGLISNDE